MFPILDPHVFAEVKSILDTYFEDNTSSLMLGASGTWIPKTPEEDEPLKRAQEILYKKYKRRAERAAKEPKIEFKVRRKN
jgi:polyphosphate kinase